MEIQFPLISRFYCQSACNHCAIVRIMICLILFAAVVRFDQGNQFTATGYVLFPNSWIIYWYRCQTNDIEIRWRHVCAVIWPNRCKWIGAVADDICLTLMFVAKAVWTSAISAVKLVSSGELTYTWVKINLVWNWFACLQTLCDQSEGWSIGTRYF